MDNFLLPIDRNGETTMLKSGEADNRWGMPSPLSAPALVLPFEQDMLPESLRAFANDIARRMQVPIDMPAVASVCALSGVTGRRLVVQPKERDTGWTKTPNLWGLIVAPPGSLKTPVVEACVAPTYKIQQLLQPLPLEQAIPREDADENTRPKGTRIIVNDATPESLHEIMSDNPQGLFLIRDELPGMLETLEKKGREGERQFFLQCWNGNSSFTMDRIGRGTITAKCCLSLLAGIQPDKLASYQRKWLLNGSGNDGFLERFQLSVWPDIPEDWVYIDEPPDQDAEVQILKIFSRIVSINPEDQPVIRFAPGAQEFFVEWLSGLERRLRLEQMHAVLCSVLSKYRSLMPSLACLFAVADHGLATYGSESNNGPPCIQLHHADQAARWCAYLESHAKRIYGSVITPGMQPAQLLATSIRNRKLSDGFTARDIKQKDWQALKEDGVIEAALTVLVKKCWLKVMPDEPLRLGGRPTTRYSINPNAVQDFGLISLA